jgi:hypothetical protein
MNYDLGITVSHKRRHRRKTHRLLMLYLSKVIRGNVNNRNSAFAQGVCATSPVLPTADVAAQQQQVPAP